MESGHEGIGSATAQWERVRNWPGLTEGGGVGRCDHALGLVPR
ncbi:hypothetical protein ACVV2G_03180 [Streptomyces ziwulingensis]